MSARPHWNTRLKLSAQAVAKAVEWTVTHALTFASHLPVLSMPYSHQMVQAHMEVAKSGTQVVGHAVHAQVKDWRALPSRAEKIKRPVYGTMPWANLVLGESAALILQGVAQGGEASNAQSFGIGVAAALAIEFAATIPAARRHTEKKSKEAVVNASLIGFWLGGAMGAAHEKLPPKQALFPIGAYMIYGTGLAALGEYNNFAEKLLNNAGIVMPILLAWGLLKKTDEMFGHKGLTERISDKTVAGYYALRSKLSSRQARNSKKA